MNILNSSTRNQAGGRTPAGTPNAGAVGGVAELTMYKERPTDGEISIEDFEKFALDRLRGVILTHQAAT